MPALWVARSKIVDPVEYKKYTDCIPDILPKFDARVLSRGARYEVMEGPHFFERFVVIEFPDMTIAKACFESEAYRTAAAFRRAGAGINELVLLEQGDATVR